MTDNGRESSEWPTSDTPASLRSAANLCGFSHDVDGPFEASFVFPTLPFLSLDLLGHWIHRLRDGHRLEWI